MAAKKRKTPRVGSSKSPPEHGRAEPAIKSIRPDEELRDFLTREGFVFKDTWVTLREEIVQRVYEKHGLHHATMIKRNLGDGRSQNEGMRWDVVDHLGTSMESEEEANLLMSVHGPQLLAALITVLAWVEDSSPADVTVGEIGAWTGTLGKFLQIRRPEAQYLGFEQVERVANLPSDNRDNTLVVPISEDILQNHVGTCNYIITSLGVHRAAVWPFMVEAGDPTHPNKINDSAAVSAATNFFYSVFNIASRIATPAAKFLYLRRIRSFVELLGLVSAALKCGWEFQQDKSGDRLACGIGFTLLEFSRSRTFNELDPGGLAQWWGRHFHRDHLSMRQQWDKALSGFFSLSNPQKSEEIVVQHEMGGLITSPMIIETGEYDKGYYKLSWGEGMKYAFEVSDKPFDLACSQSIKYKLSNRPRTNDIALQDQEGAALDNKTSYSRPTSQLVGAYISGDDRAKRNAWRRLREEMAKKQDTFIHDAAEWEELLEHQRVCFLESLAAEPRRPTYQTGKQKSTSPKKTKTTASSGFLCPSDDINEVLDPEEYEILQASRSALSEILEHQVITNEESDFDPNHAAAFFKKLQLPTSGHDELIALIQSVLFKLTDVVLTAIKGIRYHEKKAPEVRELDISSRLYKVLALIRVEDPAKKGAVMSGARKLSFPLPAKNPDALGLYKTPIPLTLLHRQQYIFYTFFPKCPSIPVLRQMNRTYADSVDGSVDLEWLSAFLAIRTLQVGARKIRAELCKTRQIADTSLAQAGVPDKTRASLVLHLSRVECWMIHAMNWSQST